MAPGRFSCVTRTATPSNCLLARLEEQRRLTIPDSVEVVYARRIACEYAEEVPMDSHALLGRLQQTSRVRSPGATAVPLAGGVSSEIWLVTDGPGRFVVKRALPKLNVRDDWFADPARNGVEHDCLAYLDRTVRGSAPRILFHDAEAGLFAMEFI